MEKNEIIGEIRKIIKRDNAFISVDLGRDSGRIIIEDENQAFPNIFDNYNKIDTALTHILDADILDTNIAISYPPNEDDINKLRVVIRFDYD